MVKDMLGVADIAAMFNVEPKTVSMWRQRYADFPEPDVTIGGMAGWDRERTEELRVWESGRPGQGRRAMPAEHIQEMLRRTFVFRFMRPDDFAWAPIAFPGIEYDHDGRLAAGMPARAAAHLIGELRNQGFEIVFQDPAVDASQAMQRVLWDRWTTDEIGDEFRGCLFDDHGRIYHGCTAFDAARYTLQRLTALGGEIRSIARDR